MRAMAVAPAVSDVCPVAPPNSPRYCRSDFTRTNLVTGSTRVLPTRVPGAGHAPVGFANCVQLTLSDEPHTVIVSWSVAGRNELLLSATPRAAPEAAAWCTRQSVPPWLAVAVTAG